MGMSRLIMERQTKLSLVDVPWPISILKCNQRLYEMLPGQQLLVTLKDADTMENLALLLSAMPGYEFNICKTKGCFSMQIKKHPISRDHKISD